MAQALSESDVQEALETLPGWTRQNDRLAKTFEFANFREAIAFIVRLAFIAERQRHHPDLRNVYNRVEIYLSTHDAGDRVTERDVKLAQAIESLVEKS